MSSLPNGTVAPPAAAPIDLAHLRGQTLDDPALQAEVLELFSAQARRIVADLMNGVTPDCVDRHRRADLLHTLCGSARAIGAWDVATDAERLERAERDKGVTQAEADLSGLQNRVSRVCDAIATMHDGQERASTRR